MRGLLGPYAGWALKVLRVASISRGRSKVCSKHGRVRGRGMALTKARKDVVSVGEPPSSSGAKQLCST